jgi:hypothetical protein
MVIRNKDGAKYNMQTRFLAWFENLSGGLLFSNRNPGPPAKDPVLTVVIQIFAECSMEANDKAGRKHCSDNYRSEG